MGNKKQKENLLDNRILESFKDGMYMYTFEKQADNLFVIRRAGGGETKTIGINGFEHLGREKWDSLIRSLKGGEENMSGLEEARATAAKLKQETEEKKEQELAVINEAKNDLDLVRQNASLSKMFDEEIKKEMSDGMGSQPLLKLHTQGRSNNELIDGSQPNDGDFFYTPSQEAFTNPNIHLLVISDGFYAEGLPDDKGETKIQYNILLGGTIIDEEGNRTMRPFLMYVTSQAIRQSLWDFRNELNKYARVMKVPKTAIVVKMTHEKVGNPNPKWAKVNPKVNNIKFSIEKFPDGTPVLVPDEDQFAALVDIQAMLKEMAASIIAAKSVEKPVGEETTVSAKEQVVEGQMVDPEEIPF